ncbi:ATPase with role in protein import into the ER [Ascosphaera pollenicola]|nr:ATPase with role in protein import into the ER [Ascosphaera pollenicola]
MLLPPSSPVLLPHTAATGTASAAHARVNSTAAPAGNVRAADNDAVAMSFMTPSSPVVVYEDHEHERTSPAPARDFQRQQQQHGRDEVEEEDDDQENMHTRVHPQHAQTYTRDDNASSNYEPDELSELDDDEYDDEDMDLDVFSQHQHQQHARKNQHHRQDSRGSGNRSRSRGNTSSNGHARSGSRDSSTASRRQQSRKNTASASRSKSRASTKHDPTNDDGHEDVSSKDILSNIPSATIDAIRNHAINQLAFSRLNSAPLSTILNHLPPEYRIPLANPHSPSTTDPPTTTSVSSPAKGKPGRTEIRHIIETTPCIGVVNREGKDAAGKPLESEYYYIPDADGDEVRSVAVTRELMKPGLRSCRKQHKQYYWKKPK